MRSEIALGKLSGLLVVALVAIEAFGCVPGALALPRSFLAEVPFGAVLLLCPALILLSSARLGAWFNRSSIIYPLTLAVGFWAARDADHPLAYAIFMAYFLMPAALAYTALLAWHVWRHREKEAVTERPRRLL